MQVPEETDTLSNYEWVQVVKTLYVWRQLLDNLKEMKFRAGIDLVNLSQLLPGCESLQDAANAGGDCRAEGFQPSLGTKEAGCQS